MSLRRLEHIVGRIEAEAQRRDRLAQLEAPPLWLDELTHQERAEVISLAREINRLAEEPERAPEVQALGERLRGIFWPANQQGRSNLSGPESL